MDIICTNTYLLLERTEKCLEKCGLDFMEAVIIDPKDNVATAIIDISVGSSVKVTVKNQEREIILKQAIPRGHKFALTKLKKGEPVVKYGEVIGVTTSIIDIGEHVHVHNVVSQRGRGDLTRKNG